MTPDDVRAAAEQLVEFHDRFAPLFGKSQAQDHAYTYLKGLMCCPERKSIEPIALCVGNGQVSGLQKFIGVAPWAYDDVQAEAQALFAEQFAPAATASPIGVVGVVDESAFAKKGTKSAGVARQHNGRLGKEDNCQVGVFLIGVAPGGVALLDHQLYLPQSWYEGETAAGRREEAHIPEDLAFRTKPEIAATLIRNVAVLGVVTLDWIVADEAYGRDGEFLDEMDRLGQRYVAEVPTNTTVWTVDPAGCVPAYSGRGQPPKRPTRESVLSVDDDWPRICPRGPGSGCKSARVRSARWSSSSPRCGCGRSGTASPGRRSGCLIRRSLEDTPEVKYYVSNGEVETPLSVMALVACTRHQVEDFFEDAKGYLGLAQYETRSWVGWHHHMTLVGLAHLFVSVTRLRLKKKSRA